MLYKMRDLTGQRFGRLVAIEPIDKRSRAKVVWKVECDCGAVAYVVGVSLTRGLTRSCGCLRRETASATVNASTKGFNLDPKRTNAERHYQRKYPEYDAWRKAVYARDNYTCQKCGKISNGDINAHHIESYTDNKELRLELSNGVTLCEDCHKDFHRIYGNHSTREKFEEWL